MKVLVTSKSFGRQAPEALRLLQEHQFEIAWASKGSPTAAEIAAEIPGCDALVVGNDTVDAGVFAAGDRLRLVHMHGTGLDGIDVRAASARGVLVANAPGANRNAVAELTVALMLVAARGVAHHLEVVKAGRWERRAGREVSGKTVGVLGLGNIGKRIVELLAGFGVRVVAYEPRPDGAWVAAHGVRLVAGPDEVFQLADFLVLALPLNDETRNLVDVRRIGLMKRDAYLVNTARGGLIDETALAAAVKEGRLAGAALDAFSQEPLPADSVLRVPGIVLTPHLAATSIETAAAVSNIVARNLVGVLVHGDRRCAVNAAAVESVRRGIPGPDAAG
jgi:D-3-phosphoglycerate dehydrogenase / 2-oxoglutarate reductase